MLVTEVSKCWEVVAFGKTSNKMKFKKKKNKASKKLRGQNSGTH